MKKNTLLILTWVMATWVFGASTQIQSSANGTIVDGYYMLEDFEGETNAISYKMIQTNGNDASDGSVGIVEKPGGTGKSLHAVNGNYDRWLQCSINLPTGKNLSDYEKLYFEIYYGTSGDNTYKDVKYSFNNGTKKDIDQTQSNLGSWKTLSIPVSELTIENSFTFEIGFHSSSGGNFDIDNLRLSGATPAGNAYTATLNPGTGTCAKASVSEIEEGSGVTLPTASPSTKCGLSGYTFAGWATSSVSETEEEPTLIPAGAWTIQENIALYAVYTDGTVYNSNPNCSFSLNGTVTDGWLMVEDFENSDIDEAFSVYKAENSGAATTATVALDPTESSNQAVLFFNKNYGHYLQLDVSLPVNRTLGNYKKISFDVICPGGMGNYQTLRVGINQNLSDVTNNGGNSLTTWTNIERDFPAGFSSYSGLSTFTLEVGFRTGAKDYYIDNIKLQLDPGLLTGADQYASKLFSVFANTIHFSTTATDVRVVDLNGRILLHAENTTQIDLNRLNPGMYIIRAVVADNPVVEKFIKK